MITKQYEYTHRNKFIALDAKSIDDFIEILTIYDVNVKEIIIEFDDSEIKIKTAIIKKLKEFAEVIANNYEPEAT